MRNSTRFDEEPIGGAFSDFGIRVRCTVCDDYQDFYGGLHDYEDGAQSWEFDHAQDVCKYCGECARLDHSECEANNADDDPFAVFYMPVAK